MNGEYLLGKSSGSNLDPFLRSWEALGELLEGSSGIVEAP